MKIKPMPNYVFIKIIKEKETVGGLTIPDSVKDNKSLKGQVLEMGDDCPKDLNKGNIVIFDKWAGVKIEENDDTYQLVKDERIMGILLDYKQEEK